MYGARKGRACVVSITQFEVDWLEPRPGYKVDESRLCELWDQIGFDVYMPGVEGRGLTAQVNNLATYYNV